ncbi:MAG: orotidine-5'-phosphate decarboxylase [Oscillospiraceae bacterium]|nr:orotidine-5'-phosphate decarboxylase [Oscillospiraceae bacterium]
MMLIDRLNEKIMACKAPICVGLDPVLEAIPTVYFGGAANAAEAIYAFNKDIIDAVYELVPAVKPQIAFYELFGSAGIACYERTVAYAKSKGLFVITDAKRNDIGNTAKAYAKAHLGKGSPLEADFLTVSPFLGEESLVPFIEVCQEDDKGVFILVRTSNAGNRMVQDAQSPNGRTVSETLAAYINQQACACLGETGYSSIGAVVGATYPHEAEVLRKAMPTSLFLVPGYGAQGGGAADVVPCFNADGLGAVVNSSRGILYSYDNPQCSREEYRASVVAATKAMQQDIYAALRQIYPKMIY